MFCECAQIEDRAETHTGTVSNLCVKWRERGSGGWNLGRVGYWIALGSKLAAERERRKCEIILRRRKACTDQRNATERLLSEGS